jgi:hypothetical protein
MPPYGAERKIKLIIFKELICQDNWVSKKYAKIKNKN